MDNLTARRAGLVIAAFTIVVTIAAGILVTVLDERDFPTLGRGLWWAVQTVTTVGYGDVTPRNTEGRVLAAIVMVTGIGFLSVVTAAVTAMFIESARRKRGRKDPTVHALEEIRERLDRIEERLGE